MVLVKRTKTWANTDSAAQDNGPDHIDGLGSVRVEDELKVEIHKLKKVNHPLNLTFLRFNVVVHQAPFYRKARFIFPFGILREFSARSWVIIVF